MATKKQVENEAEKTAKNPFDKPEKQVEQKTPETPEPQEEQGNAEFVDSDGGGIANLRKVLNIPMEEAGGNKSKPLDVPNDPLSSGEAKSERSNPFDDGDTLGSSGLDPEDMEGIGEMFEDVEALSEFGIEILDLAMNYAAQAVSGDWGQDEKYSIPESRKRKLRKPLAAVLKKRSPKVSPELAFAVFVLGAYAPMLIQAWSERQKKTKAENKDRDRNGALVVPKDLPTNDDTTKPDDYDDLITKMRANATQQEPPAPKRPPGRPKGSKDSKPRKKPVARKRTAPAKPVTKGSDDSAAK